MADTNLSAILYKKLDLRMVSVMQCVFEVLSDFHVWVLTSFPLIKFLNVIIRHFILLLRPMPDYLFDYEDNSLHDGALAHLGACWYFSFLSAERNRISLCILSTIYRKKDRFKNQRSMVCMKLIQNCVGHLWDHCLNKPSNPNKLTVWTSTVDTFNDRICVLILISLIS